MTRIISYSREDRRQHIVALLFALTLLLSGAGAASAAQPTPTSPYAQGISFFEAKEYGKAADAFKQAIKKNPFDKDALYMLGVMCENGYGVEKSEFEASELYRRAWKAGKAEAYERLNKLYGILSQPTKTVQETVAVSSAKPAPPLKRIVLSLSVAAAAQLKIDTSDVPEGEGYTLTVSCDDCEDLEAQADEIARATGATVVSVDSGPDGAERMRAAASGRQSEQITLRRKPISRSSSGLEVEQITVNISCGGWCKVVKKLAETVAALFEAVSRSATAAPVGDARSLSQNLSQGKYYGLIIGINSYRHVNKLANAVNDAAVVDQVLRERYGFENRVLLDEQATRDAIMKAMNDLRKQLTERDSLVIFYSGHGEYNKDTDTSYWLPVDAEIDDNTKWLESRSISDQLKLISAKHVLVVADSCFSGTMTRSSNAALSANTTRENYLNKLFEKPSRVLIASGGNEPVTDAGGTGHSIFSDVFINALNSPFAPVFTAEELMTRHLKESVAGRTAQTPEYKVIRNSGHDGGDFIFIKRQ